MPECDRCHNIHTNKNIHTIFSQNIQPEERLQSGDRGQTALSLSLSLSAFWPVYLLPADFPHSARGACRSDWRSGCRTSLYRSAKVLCTRWLLPLEASLVFFAILVCTAFQRKLIIRPVCLKKKNHNVTIQISFQSTLSKPF